MVEKPELPAEIAAVFRKSLRNFVAPGEVGVENLDNAELQGIPIVRLRLDSLSYGRLRDTPHAGWLILATGTDGVVYGAEIMEDRNGPVMDSLWRDPTFPALLKQLDEVVHLDELKSNDDFEMKLLSIPGILTDALWLSSGNRQFLVPVRVPDEEMLPRMRAIEVERFFTKAEQQAAAFREFDKTDLPEPGNP